MLKRFFIIFSILLLTTFLLQVLSYDVYSAAIRDNFHYNNFYEKLSETKGLIIGYSYYHNLTGGSEPIYYLYMFLCSAIGLDYSQAVLSQNIFFVFSISLLLSSIKLSLSLYAIIVIYISTNFYVFVLFSEAQRLKVGVVFGIFFIFQYIHGNKTILPAICMMLSHFQMGMLLLLKIRKFKLSFYHAIILLLALPLYPKILQKFLAYVTNDFGETLNNIISSGTLCLAFLITFQLFSKKINKSFIVFLLGCIAASVIVGKARINIFIFEGSMFYLFYLVHMGNQRKIMLYSLICVVAIVSSYNIYRIESSYSHLIQLTGLEK